MAVVGAGHVPGIVAYLNAMGPEPRDFSALEGIPAKTLGARLAPWIVPALLRGGK